MNETRRGFRQRLAPACDFALATVAGSLLFAMMTLTFVDVVMRYFFDAPIKGGFEITEMMMAVLIFAGLPLVSRKNEHVTIDAFDHFFPAAVRRALHVVIHLVCAATLVGMAWLLYRKAGSFAQIGDVTQTLKLPIAPFVYLMAVLTLATAVVHVTAAFGDPPADQTGMTSGAAPL
jgi:TRAP-type C4-dicarboxylate transport system permease small subunit